MKTNPLKMKINSGSLRFHLSISFMIMSVIILIAGTVGIYLGVLDIWQKRSEKSTLQLFEQMHYTIDTTLREADKVSKLLLVDADIQHYLEVTSGNNYTPGELVNLTNKVMERMSIILKNYEYIDSTYLFTNNGIVVGVSAQASTFVIGENEQHWFYTAGLYDRSQQLYPQLIWEGAIKPQHFHGGIFLPGDESNSLLVAMRGMKEVSGVRQAGTIVVNLNQEVLTSTYTKLAGEPGSEILIYDQYGRIISDRDVTRLGQPLSSSLLQETNLSFGSFTNEDQQVIYYKLGKTGWTVVKMLPIREFVKDIMQLRSTMVIISIITLIAAVLISYYWIRKMTKPLTKLGKAMQQMERGILGTTLASDGAKNELGMLVRGFNRMSQSISGLIADNRKAEEQKAKLEMQMLQSQIQPHFIYNTLNTIKWMAIVNKADNVSESLTTLSSLLKPIFNRSTDLMWSFREEMDYMDNYIKLMNIRYGQGIEVDWVITESLHRYKVLRFILQPIVENAIVHGMEANHYTGNIRIAAEEQDRIILLTVSDNGGGIEEERLQQLQRKLEEQAYEEDSEENTIGIGLQNVNKRMQLHLGHAYKIKIDSKSGEGTYITLSLPKLCDKE